MKLFKLLLSVLMVVGILITTESCERVRGCTDAIATNFNSNASVDNGTCTYSSTFYFDENGPNATVNVAGQTGLVTKNYPNNDPGCGLNADGCANFALPLGTYNYTATSALTSWNGSFIVDRGCATVLLQQSTGSVIFYTTQDFGTITINVNGNTKQYSGYFTGGTPACGAQGAVTFDLPPGTYAYSASSPGYTWGPTTVTISQDQCSPVLLN